MTTCDLYPFLDSERCACGCPFDRIEEYKLIDKLATVCRSLMQRTKDYNKSDRSKMEIDIIFSVEEKLLSYWEERED